VQAVVPWLIIALVAVPLVIVAFGVTRRKTSAGERPATATPQERAETEREFAEAEKYEAEWREQDKKRFRRQRLP
jgi:hypothetical protein